MHLGGGLIKACLVSILLMSIERQLKSQNSWAVCLLDFETSFEFAELAPHCFLQTFIVILLTLVPNDKAKKNQKCLYFLKI